MFVIPDFICCQYLVALMVLSNTVLLFIVIRASMCQDHKPGHLFQHFVQVVMKNTARFLSLLKSLFFLFLGVVFCDVDLSVRFGADFTYGNFAKRINGSVLQKNDSLLSRLEVEDDMECAEKCVLNQLCLSVNFESKPTGKILCELMSWGGTDYRDFFVKKEGFFHVRMMVRFVYVLLWKVIGSFGISKLLVM